LAIKKHQQPQAQQLKIKAILLGLVQLHYYLLQEEMVGDLHYQTVQTEQQGWELQRAVSEIVF
jgi:hypothetical protein